MLTIGSSDTLIIRTKMPNSGAIYTLEMQQRSMSHADVQTLVDTLKSRPGEGDVVSVWLVEINEKTGVPVTVDDITDEFDIRTVDEIYAMSRALRAAEEDQRSIRHAARMQRDHGTYNHAQQGIGR